MAGLSLLHRALQQGLWHNKRILLTDAHFPTSNHKTWCFWQKGESPFEAVVHRTWKTMYVFAPNGEALLLNTGDYSYKMIRSEDFYAHTHQSIRQHAQVHWLEKPWTHAELADAAAKGATVFSSIFEKPTLKKGEHYFLQHFKGWIIRAKQPVMPADEMYLMDFRTSQEHGTAFVYTLPLDEHRVFVEYTLFTETMLSDAQYDEGLRRYVHEVLGLSDYEIEDTEFGVIPMTDHRFQRVVDGVVRIGTAGGDTRASTGYTFTNTQRTIGRMLARMQQGKAPVPLNDHAAKFLIYDKTILEVLQRGELDGAEIFARMFRKLPADLVLQFLDGETHLLQDLRIMSSVQIGHFLPAFFASLR